MKKRILVVDDDFMIRKLLEFKLSRCGFEVIPVANEKEFWGKTFTTKPDLIILDMRLRNRNGFSVYQNLVDYADFDPHVPVILVTAFLDKKTFPRYRAGNYTLFSKPFDFEELVREIERMLGTNNDTENYLENEKRNIRENRRPSLLKDKIKCPAFMLMLIFSLWVPDIPNSIAQEIPSAPSLAFFQKPFAGKRPDLFSKPRNRNMRKRREEFATWYSKRDPHVRRRTASGEIFDDSKRTCAAWGHPFGARLKVTNLENQKSVICRVNDRGPAKRLGRQIDLSKSAFRRIANLRRGVARVSIMPVNQRTTMG